MKYFSPGSYKSPDGPMGLRRLVVLRAIDMLRELKLVSGVCKENWLIAVGVVGS